MRILKLVLWTIVWLVTALLTSRPASEHDGFFWRASDTVRAIVNSSFRADRE